MEVYKGEIIYRSRVITGAMASSCGVLNKTHIKRRHLTVHLKEAEINTTDQIIYEAQ